MAKHEIACSINAACGNPAYHDMRRTGKPVNVAVVGGGPAGKEGSAFGLAVDENLLFNPNGPILDDLPLDALAQLTRDEGPAYTAKRMEELMAAAGR